jgi:hypothetical protein
MAVVVCIFGYKNTDSWIVPKKRSAETFFGTGEAEKLY